MLGQKPGFVQLQCPPGITQVFGQVDSDDPPAIYIPNASGVVTLPLALLVPDFLSQGYTIVDGTPTPGPVRGWSFRDLPFLDWLGRRQF